MIEQRLSLSTADGQMGALVKHPDGGGEFPVVLLFHHGPGADSGTEEAMRMIADRGYYVIAPDRHYREGPFVQFGGRLSGGPESSGFQDFVRTICGTTDEMVAGDVASVLEHLSQEPAARAGAMAAFGYCVGVRGVITTMADHPESFVVGIGMHPTACVAPDPSGIWKGPLLDGVSPHLRVPGLAGSVYLAIGSRDRFASAQSLGPLIEAVTALGDRGTVDILDGADHGFAVPGATWHSTAVQAYTSAFALLDREIKNR